MGIHCNLLIYVSIDGHFNRFSIRALINTTTVRFSHITCSFLDSVLFLGTVSLVGENCALNLQLPNHNGVSFHVHILCIFFGKISVQVLYACF